MIALDMDSTTTMTHVEPGAIVGGGDTQYSRKQLKLRLVDTPYDMG
jgi:hypothetical protein